MNSSDIRSRFLEYFKKQGHSIQPSGRLIPENDPTLLFTNAGMNQFKNVFLGLETRDYSRATTSQKCVRAGGKHNDLENVGHTARHHTFFEMLGNFSFGDYFKKEAIHYAWDFLTNDLGLDKDRLYVTVFETDDEAAEIWEKQEQVPKDRIYRFGEKDNFWRMGNTGPCGPCSEIFYDFGEHVGGDPKQNVMGGEGDRFVEIWNLVFMQFNEDESGKMNPLPNPSIDTGMGLERLTTLLQGQLNNYDTELFQDIIATACKISGKEYVTDTRKLSGKALAEAEANNIALRVLADHARSSAFLIGDGVMPSNDGRGYVLRRIMRRAIRYGRNLTHDSLLPAMVDSVITKMNSAYPELEERKNIITSNVSDEEERFLKTLDQGTSLLHTELEQLKTAGESTLSGVSAFKLYDTYGFPVDLTRIMAEEQGLKVDEAGFEKEMSAAKSKAKASWKSKGLAADQAHLIQWGQDLLKKKGATVFKGYDGSLKTEGTLIGLSNGKSEVKTLNEGESGLIAFDQTCFYAESGGQVGDVGEVEGPNGVAQVIDCTKHSDVHLLHVKVTSGQLNTTEICAQTVDAGEHTQTANNHSATHLLHSALRAVLGEHIQQAGSLVEPHRLRFDFTHKSPLTEKEIYRIESLVNEEIDRANPVSTEVMSPDSAKEKGALALFGEKYGDEVRVVEMGPFSMELCGGTHVSNTSQIGLFKLVSESGVSAGVRRVEAITGSVARQYALKNIREAQKARAFSGQEMGWNDYLESTKEVLPQWMESTREQIKDLEKQIQKLKSDKVDANTFINEAMDFNKDGKAGKLVLCDLEIDDRKVLSDLSDHIKDKIKTGVVVVVGKSDKTNPIIVGVSKDLIPAIKAGDILKEVASVMGGKGGGRPEFAQGSAPNRADLNKAFDTARQLFQ
tara:strand:- start:28765 stop:31476 length:2712 start_codon:yes stop_codon:yes gene_type:complete